MTKQRPPLRRALLAAGAIVGATFSGVLFATPADAATTVSFSGGVLTVNGDAATRNSLVVGSNSAGLVTLNGTAVLGGTVRRTAVSLVRMSGGGFDDTLRFDETNGVFPRGEFSGGGGTDNLVGGSAGDSLDGGAGIDTFVGNGGADTLIGGAGNDKAVGGPGDDTVSLGADSDQFTWNPGDGSDRVDGGAGTDTLLSNGSDGRDLPTVSAGVPGRASIHQFTPPFDNVDFGGIEQVKINTAAGDDEVEVDDLAGTGIAQVRVDLDQPTSGAGNKVDVVLGNAAQRVRVTGSPATGVTVSGMAVPVLIGGVEALSVFGGSGDDLIDASALAAGALDGLVMFGDGGQGGGTRTGHNTLIGSPGDDQLFSGSDGPGDRIEGRGGNDLLQGGPGNDQLFGGDGDDTLRGIGGNDILDGGPGNNVIIP